MFASEDFKENREKSCKLELTEHAVRVLREFVYCGSGTLDQLIGIPEVALELLEAAHMMEIPSLEKGIEELILMKEDGWLGFEGALTLFVKAVKMGERYDRLKLKASNGIKM